MRSYFGTLDTVGHFNDASIHLHCNHNITYAKPANKKNVLSLFTPNSIITVSQPLFQFDTDREASTTHL